MAMTSLLETPEETRTPEIIQSCPPKIPSFGISGKTAFKKIESKVTDGFGFWDFFLAITKWPSMTFQQ